MKDADAAVRFVADYSPHIPFWPQLPQRSVKESAIVQSLGTHADLVAPRTARYGFEAKPGCFENFLLSLQEGPAALAVDGAAGFFSFEAGIHAGYFSRARAVKGQIEGPITLAFYLFRKGRAFICERELLDAVVRHVIRLARWQICRLQSAGLPVLLFIDEPALCLTHLKDLSLSQDEITGRLGEVLAAIRVSGAIAALHCCNSFPFSLLSSLGPDILSFDAHSDLDKFFSSPAAIQFLREGGRVAFGLVPTWRCLDELSAKHIFARWFVASCLHSSFQSVLQNSLITASCGLGLLDYSAARSSFVLARELQTLAGQYSCLSRKRLSGSRMNEVTAASGFPNQVMQ